MNQPIPAIKQEEWVRILGKGMVTIPKSWRDELGLMPGKVVRAQMIGRKVILESEQEEAPYRIYTDEEIKAFVNRDKLPKPFAKAVDKKLSSLRKS